MLNSMTGFGRYELTEGSRKISVEIKSVNSKYLDLSIRMSKRFNPFESEIRKKLGNYMTRGKIDVSIFYEDKTESAGALSCNKELAAQYVRYARELSVQLDIDFDLKASGLMRLPEVFVMETPETDEEAVLSVLLSAVEKAAEKFEQARALEGEALKNDILAKLDVMAENVRFVEERYPQIVKEHEERIRAKVSELLAGKEIDENVLAAELVVYSDKLCTDEETVRLMNHIGTMKKELTKGGPIGRKLDFLAQEMNREANTILSKSNDLRTSDIGISLKTDIEKIREQIQNIE